jgi:hypothetical protein
MPPRTKATASHRQGNDPRFDLRSELYRIAGVDLTDSTVQRGGIFYEGSRRPLFCAFASIVHCLVPVRLSAWHWYDRRVVRNQGSVG